MADFPEAMLVGSLSLAGKVPTILAQGVTFELASSLRNEGFKVPSKALVASPMSVAAIAIEQLVLNVKTAVGYVPAGVTVLGFSIASSDLDSGGTALVQSIYLGDSQLVTGVTTGVAGTNAHFVCVPTSITVPTVVYLKTTTAPTTAAAGTVTVHSYYYSN